MELVLIVKLCGGDMEHRRRKGGSKKKDGKEEEANKVYHVYGNSFTTPPGNPRSATVQLSSL